MTRGVNWSMSHNEKDIRDMSVGYPGLVPYSNKNQTNITNELLKVRERLILSIYHSRSCLRTGKVYAIVFGIGIDDNAGLRLFRVQGGVLGEMLVD